MINQSTGDKVTLVLKEQADRLLEDLSFLESWDQLIESNQIKSSIFQKPAFLKAWFRAKRVEYAPVILTEYREEKLTGLLVLAVSVDHIDSPNKKTKIVGAGEYDAEYQGYLCSHNQPVAFLEKALEELFRYFPKAQISFRFFLDEEVATNLKLSPKLRKWLTVQEYSRPIAALQSPEFDKILRKRHLKAKINRFNRAGNVELEVVHEPKRLMEVLPQVMLLYDFRQGALFNKYPSAKFLNENPLFVELLDSGTMHFSILKLNDEIASCIVCYHCNKWMHLAGMITYSPFFAKLSPGLVHIHMLGESFRSQGYGFFDLTPGYDGYKDKFATSNDVVRELTFCSNRTAQIAKKAKVAFQDILVRKGIRPMSFDLEIKKKKYLLGKKAKGIFRAAGKLIRPSKKVQDLSHIAIKTNSIQDLFSFQEEGLLTKWEFLEEAFSKIEEGNHFRTATLNGKLISCVWFMIANKPDQSKPEETESADTLTPCYKASYFSESVSSQCKEIFEKTLTLQ